MYVHSTNLCTINPHTSSVYSKRSKANSLRLSAAYVVSACILSLLSVKDAEAKTLNQGVLTLAGATALAMKANPSQQKLWQQRENVLERQYQQAGKRQNPTLDIEVQGFNTDEREQTLSISQSIDWFGKRALTQHIWQTKKDAEPLAQVQYAAKQRVLVMARYQDALLAERQQQLANKNRILQENALSAANKRLKAGRISRLERDRLALTHQQALLQLQQAKLETSLKKNQLAELWGDSEFRFAGLKQTDVPNLSWQIQRLANATQSAAVITQDKLMERFDGSITMQLFEQKMQTNAAKQQLANSVRWENPTLTLGVTRKQNKMDNLTDTDHQAMLGLSVPLPVFQSNQAEQRILATQSDLLRSQLQLHRQQTRLHLSRLARAYDNYQKQYQLITRQQLPIVEKMSQKTIIGFEHGKFNVTDVQNAQAQTLTVRQAALAAQTQLWKTGLGIEAIMAGFSVDTDLSDPTLWDGLQQTIITDSLSLTQ